MNPHKMRGSNGRIIRLYPAQGRRRRKPQPKLPEDPQFFATGQTAPVFQDQCRGEANGGADKTTIAPVECRLEMTRSKRLGLPCSREFECAAVIVVVGQEVYGPQPAQAVQKNERNQCGTQRDTGYERDAERRENVVWHERKQGIAELILHAQGSECQQDGVGHYPQQHQNFHAFCMEVSAAGSRRRAIDNASAASSGSVKSASPAGKDQRGAEFHMPAMAPLLNLFRS